MKDKWRKRFNKLAREVSLWSEDNSTQVGAVIVNDENDILSMGWNGLPRGVELTEERLERPTKYLFFEHAERNAIYNATRNGVSLKDTVLVVSFYPCSDCARAIIQAGIKTVYFNGIIQSDVWNVSNKASADMFREAGVTTINFSEGWEDQPQYNY